MNKNSLFQGILFLLLTLQMAFFSSCRKTDAIDEAISLETTSELGQQVGDAMAGIDESTGTSSGTFALNEVNSNTQLMQAYVPMKSFKNYMNIFEQANAASCYGYGFGTCASGAITRSFSGCTVGTATFNGTTSLTFNQSNCRLDTVSDTVKRNPDYTITAASGAQMIVSKLLTGGDGQKLTLLSGTGASKVFSLTNDGIRRVLSYNNKTYFDMTTTITSAITVTGSGRTRSLSGGSLRLQNNLTTEQCDISPSASSPVTWSSTCTCASSGTWSGSCQTSGAFSLEITGCGTATLTVGSTAKSVTLTRCTGS